MRTHSDPVVVLVDGRRASWLAGFFTGDPEVVAFAEDSIRVALPVEVLGETVLASGSTPLGAAAAMLSFAGGSGIIESGPEDVFATLAPEQESFPE